MEKEQALGSAMAQIERQFGKGAIMRMGDPGARMEISSIPTGALGLDLALGIGGLPRGRIVEVFGPEASGKTTLLYHLIAEAQRGGGLAAFIDAEHAMDPNYARRIGVNVDELLVSQPDHGEQALEIADLLIRSAALDVVAIDSVAALVPKAEIEGEMGDTHVGLQARLMSQALRKLANAHLQDRIAEASRAATASADATSGSIARLEKDLEEEFRIANKLKRDMEALKKRSMNEDNEAFADDLEELLSGLRRIQCWQLSHFQSKPEGFAISRPAISGADP